MEEETENIIIAKIVISLHRLLSRVKENKKIDKNKNHYDIQDSYGRIASYTLLRKATVADTFNGRTLPNFKTLTLIVEAMGYKLSDFAKEYDSIVTSEAQEFLARK